MENKKDKSFEEIIREKYSEKKEEVSPDFWGLLHVKLEKADVFETNTIPLPRRKKINYLLAASVVGVLISFALFFLLKKEAVSPIQVQALNQQMQDHRTAALAGTPDTAKVTSRLGNADVKKREGRNDLQSSVPDKAIVYAVGKSKNEILLPDSSKIFINRHSTVTYLSERKVTMNGEVFFEVHPDPERKFEIICGDAGITVLGTSFNIRAGDSGTVEVSVLHGKVAFSSIRTPDDKTILTKGFKGTLYPAGNIITSEITDLNVIAWKEDVIVFNNSSMPDVATVLQKYFDIKIKLPEQKFKNCTFTGSFKKPELSKILKVIGATLNIRFEQDDDEYTLSGKGCE
jgi:ferric-dicitrate binding protein FerR (iron transport regulator)